MNLNWLIFALITVFSWGVYGILLHSGQTAMADKDNALYKSFLFVGIAYFLTAVLAPLAMLVVRKANWNFPVQGMTWSLVAGIAGAIGAFCTLLAFLYGRPYGIGPGVVMAIVFGGAPVVNAIVSLILNPPDKGWTSIKPQFFLGILMAAAGGALVTFYKPAVVPHGPPPAAKAAVAPATPK